MKVHNRKDRSLPRFSSLENVPTNAPFPSIKHFLSQRFYSIVNYLHYVYHLRIVIVIVCNFFVYNVHRLFNSRIETWLALNARLTRRVLCTF